MKKYIFLSPLFLAFTFCEPERAPDVASLPGEYLQTGCYYITEDSSGFRKQSHGDNVFYYLNPKPIIQVSQFKDVQMSNREGFNIFISLNESGTKAFSEATEKSIGKTLGLIIDNTLIMVPKVSGKIDGGSLQITGNFTEDEILEYYRKIKISMDNSAEK